ncbi:coiled-coil domain-containing protein 191 isoform X3 [Halyomorpha halys]|uniref:coiled-coil domain-containing protein 191 isoform X3 n=1 Tax=Halyomorpha halys TaxID=286706 RepID=UPI0034D1FFF0
MTNVVFIECTLSIFVLLVFWTSEMELKNKNPKIKFSKTKNLPVADRKLILCRKYFNLWKIIIQYKKRNKRLAEKDKLFEEKIVSFISNLRISANDMIFKNSYDNLFENCKPDVSTKIKKGLHTEIYQNRFQAQKSIINNQKALIAEQHDIINKLKSSASATDEHHLTTPYQDYNNLDKSTEKTKLLPKPVEHPLVKRMKEREEERKNRWSILALKKKEKEKFLAEKLLEEEEERKKLEEEKRKLKIQEKREKDRIIKEMEMKKKREQEIAVVLSEKVNSFYKRLLCVKTMQIWKGYLKHLQYVQSKCAGIYDLSIIKNGFLTWKHQVVSTKNLLHNLATRLDETYTLLSSWYRWKWKIYETRRLKREITIWYDTKITRNTFKKWLNATYKSINHKEFLLQSFVIIYDRILLLKTFGLWKQLPRILYIEREKEKRLREWENRVKSILPDYSMQLL